MEQIALIYGSTFVYWSRILLVLAAAAAVCVYLAVYLSGPEKWVPAAVSVAMAAASSLALARLLHWYCRPEQYAGLAAALTDHSRGDYALAGVFAGCILTACILRLLRLSDDLRHMLDCMAVAGSAGIAVGRLSCFFSAADRGMAVTTLQGLPWAWPATNPVTGVQELRLATFFLQALAAAFLFLVLLGFQMVKNSRKRGDTFLIFLLCHCASQVLLDSTRYDSLYFRSNGFVSVVQVLSACGLGLTAILFSVRLVRIRGWRRWYLLLWLGVAGLMGLAGYMEYFVQRHGYRAVLGYSIMAAVLLGIVVLTLTIRHLAVCAERKQQMQAVWTQQEVFYGDHDSQ